MNSGPLLEQKRRSANTWIEQYNKHKDKSAASNACMAIGRYAGAVEMRMNLEDPNSSFYEAYVRAHQQAFDAFNQVLEGHDVTPLPE